MPNWCNNLMTISHNDPAMMERAVKAWNSGEGFLKEFIPIPYELTLVGGARIDITKITNMDHHREMEAAIRAINLKYFGHADWYDFCCSEWGTKWDIGTDGDKAKLDGNSMTVRFDSAWSPPTRAYEKLAEMGFQITAYYSEFGMQFCGRWDDGIDESFQIPNTADEARKVIPVDIDEAMFVIETVENFEGANA
jgi:hypothetical protein